MKELGARLYLDTNALVYFLEAHPTLGPPMRALLTAAPLQNALLFTSELSLAEALVLPLRNGHEKLVDNHMEFISSRPGFEVVPVARDVLIESARLRANSSIKLPDAVHVATAMTSHCSTFITEDRDIRAPIGLNIVKVSDLSHHIGPTS